VSAASERLQNILDEGRILILGAQIILGLLYRSVFEPGFGRLPSRSQHLIIGALTMVLVTFVLLMGPVAYHRIVDHGANRSDFESFVLAIMKPTLPLFALSMGLTLYIATERIAGSAPAAICSVAGAPLAWAFWYGVGSGRQKSRKSKPMKDSEGSETLSDRIKHVLTEARFFPARKRCLDFSL